MNTITKLDRATLSLHWLVALGILSLMPLGFYMATVRDHSLFQTHKECGVVLFVIILCRVWWRLKTGWPKHASDYFIWEQKLSKVVHWTLLICMILMPIFGMVNSGFSGYGIAVFGFEIIPMNFDTAEPSKIVPFDPYWKQFGVTSHSVTAYIMLAAIILHLAGALKHHFIDKDLTLLRMLNRAHKR